MRKLISSKSGDRGASPKGVEARQASYKAAVRRRKAKRRQLAFGKKALLGAACAIIACLGAGMAFAGGEQGGEALPADDKQAEATFEVAVSPNEDVKVAAAAKPGEGSAELTATAKAKAAGQGGAELEASYQWQILVDEEAGLWASIQGQDAATVGLTVGMLSGALDGERQAQVRCVATVGEESQASDPVTVTVVDGEAAVADGAAEASGAGAPAADAVVTSEGSVELREQAATDGAASGIAALGALGGIATYDSEDGDNAKKTYNIAINYVFENNEIVSDPYTASLAEGSSFSATVTFPTVQGYLPYVGETQQNSMELNYTSISEDVTSNVVYKPTNVNYTVIHYQQNVDNDQYTIESTETKQGLTGSQVPEVAKTFEGFYSLLYERPAIAADGNTVIEVYYDRYYYLMNFVMDGGYGTEPVYARYGAEIGTVTEPTKAGYAFNGWSDTEGGTTAVTLPTTMPAESKTYYAIWQVNDTAKVTVVFWGENADDEQYSYLSDYTKEINLKPGSEFTYSEDEVGLDSRLWKFVTSDTITVAPDGSSVMNVYCDRVEYDIKFYDKTGKTEYTDSRITAKWGANIGNAWSNNSNGTVWAINKVNNDLDDLKSPYQVYLLQMPVSGGSFYGPKTGNYSEKAYYYVEMLDDDTAEYVTHENAKYKLHHVDTFPNNNTYITDSDKYAIEGFKFEAVDFNDEYIKNDKNKPKYDGAKFYYSRQNYTLTFNDQYDDVKNETVKFEASLSTYEDYVPEVPSAYEPGSVIFGGWYQNPQCTGEEYKLDEHTMPSHDIILYAKWVPVTHTVKFYLTEKSESVYKPEKADTEASFTVSHGDNIAEEYVKNHLEKSAMNEAKPNGDYTFVMWCYYENGEKKPFDPSTQIRKDLTLYGEWSSNTLKQYTVQYVLKSDHSVKVADDLTGSGLAGTTKTFDAKGGTELYADYQGGYFPTVQSQSLLLDIESDSLVVTFEYVPMTAVPYTVKYVEKDTGKSLADDKVVSDNRKAVVTETFKPISGYMPDAYQKRLVVTADGENILYFYYSKDEKHAYYKITHYTQNTVGETWTEYASSQAMGDIGTRYTSSPMTIPGFTYKETKYVVNGTEVTDVTAEGAKLTADGLEINLYYERNKYPYQVRYLEQGSGNVLHDPTNGTGKYGQVVSESAIDIEGYDKVDPTSAMLNIRIDEGEGAPNLNIITFYYKEQEVTINYVAIGPEGATDFGSVSPTTETVKVKSGTAQGSTPTVGGGFKFVGWYKDEACTQPVDASWVTDSKITPAKDANGKNVVATYYAKFEYDLTSLTITKKVTDDKVENGDTFVFTVKGGNLPSDGIQVVISGKDMKVGDDGVASASVTIDGLKVGSVYTVTEDMNWSWRYSASSSGLDTDGKIILDADKTENAVVFTNTKTNDKWLDFSDWCKNLFNGSENGKITPESN